MARQKIEITVSDQEKAQLQRASDACALKLATWAKAQLLLAAHEIQKRAG